MDFDNIEDIRAYFADDEFARKCLGATIDDYDFETGIATVSMEIDDRHHNAQGFVMGGVFFSLADYALAVASNVNQSPSASTNSSIAHMRRVKGNKGKEITMYKIGKFTFDTQKQVLMIDDKVTKLTTKESELLSLLCAHANQILERNYALKTIWIDDNYFNARSMDVYITKLRKHLKDDPSIEIINIHGKGYKLIAPEPERKK